MAEEEQLQKTRRGRQHFRRIIMILSLLLVLLAMMFFALFIGFNYFGERLLRDYLQDKISKSSRGIYHAGFRSLHVNILTGKVVLDSFELVPDTLQYQRLKEQGKVSISLYRLSMPSLTIDKVRFRQIFAGNRINFRQVTFLRPVISIEGFPDTLAPTHNRWRLIYEDLYPVVSDLFNDFHIDSVKVSHGLLLAAFNRKSGSKTTGDYEFSAVLKDVSVNPFSYYNRERVFYSRDVDLVIHNFESQLADSLYSLRADEIGFSLTKSILYGRKASLTPNLQSGRIRLVQSGDLFGVDLPAFSISGIDLYKAMTGREVEVSKVSLKDFFVRVYRNQAQQGTVIHKKTKKKITLAGLYTVVAKELHFIAIDSLFLENGSFEFYENTSVKRPELKIGTVNLELGQFRIDSLAHLDPQRIFYSRAIELNLERISLYLNDGIHCVSASSINFSTRNSLIDVHEASIFPNVGKNLLHPEGRLNTMFINLPRLAFTGIDLKKVFNRRILDFEKLTIVEPEAIYTRHRASKNPDPKFKKPEDFFEEENEDVVYDLLKKYLRVIKGNEINITRGHVKYSLDQEGRVVPLATSSFDLSMKQFLIDSVHGMNEQGYFYSRDFHLDLSSVSVVSPDSLKHLWADRVHIDTKDSLLESENIRIVKAAGPTGFSSRRSGRHTLSYEFTLGRFQINGLNHKKLFLEKVLKANEIVLDRPTLLLKTNNNMKPLVPPAMSQLFQPGKVVHAFEIGRFLVQKGAVSYDGEEDRKASYFFLKDIDFVLLDATIRLPHQGMHDGLIRFDSLHLKVVPLRAVIADSSYILEARNLEVHSYPADIILKGITVTPVKAPGKSPGSKTLATVVIPRMELKGFYFERAIFDNEWLLDELKLEKPSVSVDMLQEEAGQDSRMYPDPAGFIRIPAFMKTVSVRKALVSDGTGKITIRRPDKTISWSMEELMAEVTRFRVDSVTRSNPRGAPLFNADDIRVSAQGFSRPSSDSMYTFSSGRFGFSTGNATAFFDSVSVTPNYSRFDFSRKLGHQTDRIVMKIPGIRVSGVDFRKMVSNRQLIAGKVSLDGLRFESYRDKRLPFPAGQRPLMPGRALKDLGIPVCIDTMALADGFALYEEQSGDEPGRIFFDRMTATLTGVNNLEAYPDPGGPEQSLDLHCTLRMMGVTPAEAWFNFQTGHPRDTFTVKASIGEMDLTSVNPMLSKLMPASIRKGTSVSTEIVRINGNGDAATGLINFRYNDLAIKLHETKPGTWNRWQQSLLTGVANFILADGNPGDDGKMKSGMIYYQRDPSRGFFNFCWKSILSGLKSTAGINSAQQKEMIREEKQRAHSKQQQEKKQGK